MTPDKAVPVLLVTRNLPPLRGGMERLNLHLALALQATYSLSLSGPRGCAEHVPIDPRRVVETRHRPLWAFLLGCTFASLRIARRFRPRLVIAGSGLTAPLAWMVSWLTGARSVVYLHGLDLIAESVVYRGIWIPLIRRMQWVLVNSRNTARLAENAGISKEKIRILHPGTDVPGYDPAAGRQFRERYALGDGPLLLSVGRLTRRKGLAEFVEQCLPTLLKSVPEVVLLVIGDDARDALQKRYSSQLERIKQCAAAAGLGTAIRFMPPCDDATLSAAYAAADVHVFPVQDLPDDVEGFGMVAIEAAAHGLPTVAFDVGGVSDAVVEGRSGELVAPGDYGAMAAAIGRRLLGRNDASARFACVDAARTFEWSSFGQRLRTLLDEILSQGRATAGHAGHTGNDGR